MIYLVSSDGYRDSISMKKYATNEEEIISIIKEELYGELVSYKFEGDHVNLMVRMGSPTYNYIEEKKYHIHSIPSFSEYKIYPTCRVDKSYGGYKYTLGKETRFSINKYTPEESLYLFDIPF